MAKALHPLKIIVTILGVVVALPILAAVVFILTFDANQYRSELAKLLSQQLGRQVELSGELKLGFSVDGFSLTVKDASIDNPEWASRRKMAQVGELSLTVALAPLLQQQLKIERILLTKADIAFESSGSRHNWIMTPEAPPTAAEAAKSAGAPAPAISLSYDIQNIAVRDSVFAMREGNAPPTIVQISKLNASVGSKVNLDATGSLNQQPLELSLAGGSLLDLLSMRDWPLKLQLRYDTLTLDANGGLADKAKTLRIDTMALALPMGELQGNLTIRTGGERPLVQGKLSSNAINLGANPHASAAASSNPTTAVNVPSHSARLIPDTALDFSALRLLDADVKLDIAKLEQPGLKLEQIKTDLKLQAGRLTLAPLQFLLAEQLIAGELTIESAGATPAISVQLQGKQLDSNRLLALFNANQLAVGPADFDLNLRGSGQSPHAIASALAGQINLTVGSGPAAGNTRQALAGLLGQHVSTIALLGEATFSCLATRLVVEQGLMQPQGFLLDTNLATLAGVGTINLGQENLDLTFKPLGKDKRVEALIAPVRITGSFLQPVVKMDQAVTAQKLASQLLGTGLVPSPGQAGGGVPLVGPTNSQINGCVEALRNPVYPAATTAPTNQGLLGKPVQEKLQGVTQGLGKKLDEAIGQEGGQQLRDSLEKGLGIKLFGQ